MITVTDLSYEYPGKRVLKNVAFTVAPGSVTALVGPNGAGKTTLLRCLAGIEQPFSGRITIDGIDVNAEPRRAQRLLGYLSDFFGLYDDLTVRQCLIFAGLLHAMPESEAEKKAAETARLLELTPWLDRRAKQLSRGWRQRLGIAQAIIHAPKLLLLDEPAAGLDPEARVALSALFRNLQQQGMTILVSSHILAELEDYCTAMLVLRDGAIIEHGGNAAQADGASLRITFARDAGKYRALIESFPGVSQIRVDGQTISLRLSGGEAQRQELLKQLIGQGAPIAGFDSGPESLQDIYLSLSGHSAEAGKAEGSDDWT